MHAHEPLEQYAFVPHSIPHAPQLSGSLATAAQMAVPFCGTQTLCPAEHAGRHIPPTQLSDESHTFPQAPQFALSVATDAQ